MATQIVFDCGHVEPARTGKHVKKYSKGKKVKFVTNKSDLTNFTLIMCDLSDSVTRTRVFSSCGQLKSASKPCNNLD